MIKIRNSMTTGYTAVDGLIDMNRGIFIDIFPVVNEPDDDALRIRENKKHIESYILLECMSRKLPKWGGC